MDQPRPAHVVGAPGDLRDRVVASLDPPPGTVTAEPEVIVREGADPGVVLILADGLDGSAVFRLLDFLGQGEGEWTPCLVLESPEGVRVRTLSVGWLEELDGVAAFREGDDDRLLELRRVVRRIARARHDINNPLTSGMAETQLLLMDVEDPEARSALDTVQTQLRRIRDLVADTRGVRPGVD